jgi:hypothetical protein
VLPVNAGRAGRAPACFTRWEALCRDVRGLILDKLSLPALARAAPTCQEFKGAYLKKVADERVDLIRAGEEGWGNDSFHALVAALQRPLCGCSSSPSLSAELDGSEGIHHGRSSALIGFAAPFKYGVLQQDTRVARRLVSHGCAVSVHMPTVAKHLFSAQVSHGVPQAARDRLFMTLLEVFRFGRSNVAVRFLVRRKFAGPAVALLLAVSTEVSEALPAFCRSPLTVDLFPAGAAIVEEAEELIAPLRPLAESITIYPRIGDVKNDDALRLVHRKVQTRPLGVVKVRVF